MENIIGILNGGRRLQHIQFLNIQHTEGGSSNRKGCVIVKVDPITRSLPNAQTARGETEEPEAELGFEVRNPVIWMLRLCIMFRINDAGKESRKRMLCFRSERWEREMLVMDCPLRATR